MMKKNKGGTTPMDAGLKFLTAKARTVREMEHHLESLNYSEYEVYKVDERLKELGYLDDAKYAADFVSTRLAAKPVSRRNLRAQLYTHKLPKDLIEAARIAGASNLRIFLSIGLPLAKVGLVTIGLFTLLGYWNDFQLSLYQVNNSELFPVQKMLYTMMANISFLVSGSVDTSVLSHAVLPTNTAIMVMTVLTVLPVAFVFPLAQKYFVKGITVGAVKG